jgi:putative peptide zinc metalloprotease protein
MIQLRPTFSESWYRVAGLKARLRASAQISRQFYRGERWYVVRDPAGNQFHRLSDAAYRFIGLLDGSRTVEEAWDVCGGQLADDAPTQPEIIQILSHLYSANLIEADVTPDATVLLRRHKDLTKRKMQGRLMNVLFPRIPLWDPDRFLRRWMPVVQVGFSWFGAAVWLAVVIFAITQIAPHYDQLQIAAKNAIDPKNWFFLWGVFVGIKLIHELGHAFSCRRFGGECHELGIMFLVFIPTPYVDASAAWSFPSRWQRIFVGAGGMIVELFVAAVLAIVWVHIDHKSLPGVLCYNAMLIASVSTLIFNANPLLRYDGYYILSDFLEIPNLRQKSSEYALGLIKRHIFGVKASQPLPPIPQRMWLLAYAVASGIYRIFVGFVIILVVAYKIPILGVLMAIGGVITWAVVPVYKLTKYLMLEPELHRKRARATAFCVTVATICLIVVGLIQFNVIVTGEGIVEPDKHVVMHIKTPGFVSEIDAHDGDSVTAGQKILVCHDDRLDTQMASLRHTRDGLKVQLSSAAATDQAQREEVELELGENQKEIDDVQRQLNELTITAPIDGVLIAPKLADFQGAYLPRGQEVGTVAVLDHLLLKAIVDQTDAELISRHESSLAAVTSGAADPVQVSFVGRLGIRNPATIGAILPAAQDKLPSPSDTQNGGGSVVPDQTDPKGEKGQTKQFEVDVKIDNPQGTFYAGQRAYVRFEVEKRPLYWTWTRRFLQLLQTHENDSKLT